MPPTDATDKRLCSGCAGSKGRQRVGLPCTHRIRNTRTLVCLLVTACVASIASRARAEDEVITGRSAAGELKVDIGFTQPLELPASVFPGITGYATGEVGFHSTILDDVTNDFYQLSSAADFRFILVAKDSGMEVWNDTGSGYMGIGETFFIGPPPFDTHPVWNIVTGTPGGVYSLTLKLHDVNGVYADSAPFALSFTPLVVSYVLHISQTDPLHAVLFWPTNAVNWALESAASVGGTNWISITNAPVISGTNYVLNVDLAASQQFYRLHKQ